MRLARILDDSLDHKPGSIVYDDSAEVDRRPPPSARRGELARSILTLPGAGDANPRTAPDDWRQVRTTRFGMALVDAYWRLTQRRVSDRKF